MTVTIAGRARSVASHAESTNLTSQNLFRGSWNVSLIVALQSSSMPRRLLLQEAKIKKENVKIHGRTSHAESFEHARERLSIVATSRNSIANKSASVELLEGNSYSSRRYGACAYTFISPVSPSISFPYERNAYCFSFGAQKLT